MDSNTHSTQPPVPSEPLGPFGPLGGSVGLAGLPAVVGELAAEDLDQLAESALAEELLALRGWLDGLEGQWLRRLAAVDARGAAGADRGERAASTAGWLRNRLRLGAGAARDAVRTARALFRGPLSATAQALTCGPDGRFSATPRPATPPAPPPLTAALRRLTRPEPSCPVGGWGPNDPDHRAHGRPPRPVPAWRPNDSSHHARWVQGAPNSPPAVLANHHQARSAPATSRSAHRSPQGWGRRNPQRSLTSWRTSRR